MNDDFEKCISYRYNTLSSKIIKEKFAMDVGYIFINRVDYDYFYIKNKKFASIAFTKQRWLDKQRGKRLDMMERKMSRSLDKLISEYKTDE